MPDHPRGYTVRGVGYKPTDKETAEAFRRKATQPEVHFDESMQRVMIEALVEGCAFQKYRLHAVFFEITHVHFLVSWRIQRGWLRVRAGLRQSMARKLNESFPKREWFSENGSRRRVRDREHFEYLTEEYRRKHKGLWWVGGVWGKQ